jgi:DNA (cytosine-5)-methyltransferase 1
MNTLGLFETYKIKKPIRLIELFAGYGSQALALERLNVDFEHHQVVEFDKYAIKTYNALHDTNFETQDITKLKKLNITETNKYDYVLTYSFPCTDLSIAGKMLGMKSGTRSGLLWEVERLLKNAKELPQVLLMENVTQVHGNKFKEDFDDWVRFLAKLGYSNQWKDLNAKDYGIPQNRNRTFMVSILGDYEYHFPKPFELKLKLKDMLEDEVDEKYYINDYERIKIANEKYYNLHGGKWDKLHDVNKRVYKDDKESPTITTMQGGSREVKVLISHAIGSREFETNGWKEVAPTLCARDYKDPKVLYIPEDTIKGYAEAHEGDGVYINRPHQKRGVVQKEMIQTLKTSVDDLGVVLENLKIRKITPRESFRLMGLYDKDIDKIIKINSSTQLYKQAGNSIVVQVLEHIFKELL